MAGSLNNAGFLPQLRLSSKNQTDISKQIRAAMEEHGGFALKCEGREYFTEEMFLEMEKLFRLNAETKAKYLKTSIPHYESMAVKYAKAIDEEVDEFTCHMWPEGNEKFCETLKSTSKDLLELTLVIMEAVVSSYGLDRELMSPFSSAKSSSLMAKYAPPANGEEALALPTHTDSTYITIVRSNDVPGLKVKSKDGSWFDVNPEKGSFVVFVGQLLKAWSNGKLKAPLHKVIISGEKDRYSYAFSLSPEEDELVQTQSEFIDDEHPARFKPFLYKDFLTHHYLNYNVDGSLEEFAGI